jgi:hypothetical protein
MLERMSYSAIRDWAVGVGLIVSGGLWLAVTRFYGELGLTPGDVGIGLGEVLERSVGVLVFVAVIESAVALFLAEVGLPVLAVLWRDWPDARRPVRVRPRKAAQAPPGTRVVRGWIPVGIALPALLWVADGATNRLWIVLILTLAVAWSWIWVLVVDAALVRGAIVVMTFVLVVGSIAISWAEAYGAVSRVKHGMAFHDAFEGITSIAIAARPTRVELGGVTRCLLLLGAADGATILYDPRRDRVERVPSVNLRLTLDRSLRRCD